MWRPFLLKLPLLLRSAQTLLRLLTLLLLPPWVTLLSLMHRLHFALLQLVCPAVVSFGLRSMSRSLYAVFSSSSCSWCLFCVSPCRCTKMFLCRDSLFRVCPCCCIRVFPCCVSLYRASRCLAFYYFDQKIMLFIYSHVGLTLYARAVRTFIHENP